MSLQKYRTKRDFSATPEPRGKAKGAAGTRFVIQKHAARRLHYDLRLEVDGTMKSWAVTRGPSLVPGEKRLAVQVEDHPIEYNDFEGTIPKGQYGGGTVMIWDRGRWEPDGDPRAGLKKGHLHFTLHGEKLDGAWHLVRMKQRAGEKQPPWLLIKSDDEAARGPEDPDILEQKTRSVVTGRTMDEITAGKAPKRRKVAASGRAKKATAKKPAASKTARKKPSAKKPAAKQAVNKKAAAPKRAAARASAAATKTAVARPKAPATQRRPRAAVARARSQTAPPDFVAPCLATLVSKAPGGSGWIHEVKIDGYRMQGRIAGDDIALRTRSGLDWTAKFKPVAEALRALPTRSALIDGEIVVEDERGVSSFSMLQGDLKAGRRDRFRFYVFDLLFLDGRDLRAEPLLARKAALAKLCRKLPADGVVHFSDHFEDDGALVLKHACRMTLEGIVSKRADAPYRSGRNGDWLKAKCSQRQEFIVAGYTPATSGPGIRSLVVGYRDKGKLIYAGRVGTGFSHADSVSLAKTLKPLRAARSPFGAVPPEEARRKAVWVEPQIVIEVEYRGWTGDGLLRHAAFQGVREDKGPREVVREEPVDDPATVTKKASKKAAAKKPAARKSTSAPAPGGVKLTHPDRVYWEDVGVTKQMLADYYVATWDWIAPHIVHRPLSLLRCPDGVTKECFFQKHATAGAHKRVRVEKASGEDVIVIEDLPGLLSLVQMGTIEIHPRGATVDDLERCDRLIFDLDPGDGVGWDAVVAAAREVRERLAALGLESFLKISGGKGLHVVLPIAKTPWEPAKAFAHDIAKAMAADSPERYVANMAKRLRHGRIFVDYLRNSREATAVAPYSPRARPGAAVATPVRWEELGPQLRPNQYTVLNLGKRLARLRNDPWAQMGEIDQKLPSAASRKRR